MTSVDDEHKLVCQAPGCGRGIAKAIHVIRDQAGDIRVIGSGCYARLAGHQRATADGPAIGGFDGRRLTQEERALMLADTAAFIARMEAAQWGATAVRREVARKPEQRSEYFSPTARRSPGDQWTMPTASGPEALRGVERVEALDKLARFRMQQARAAAQLAIRHWPELSAQALEVVVDAMVLAKAEYLARGGRMDAPDARRAIELAAVAALAERVG